jgi:putative FmdB family regulatory protein
MPLYRYKCSVCRRGRDIFKKIADIDRTERCGYCNFEMNRQIQAPMVIGDYPGYQCPVTDRWIEGRKAHEENLRRTGCRVLEPGERESYMRNASKTDEALDRSVEESVDGFIANLPTDKRDSLAAALENGMDAAIVRQTPEGD